MRKMILLLLVLMTVFAFSSLAYAHPPSDINITFDPATKILTAVIMHRVANPLNHYIKRVDVGLNGEEMTSLSFSRQDNNSSQTITYHIPDVKIGDTLSVEAYCSISGKLKKEITVGSGK